MDRGPSRIVDEDPLSRWGRPPYSVPDAVGHPSCWPKQKAQPMSNTESSEVSGRGHAIHCPCNTNMQVDIPILEEHHGTSFYVCRGHALHFHDDWRAEWPLHSNGLPLRTSKSIRNVLLERARTGQAFPWRGRSEAGEWAVVGERGGWGSEGREWDDENSGATGGAQCLEYPIGSCIILEFPRMAPCVFTRCAARGATDRLGHHAERATWRMK